jgi:predicted O-methyltransferase YrrM
MVLDDEGRPSERLLDLALAAIQHARVEDLGEISRRITGTPRWPDRWPGEHYKLLVGLVKALAPQVVIEIGTYQGLSALALAKRLPPGGVVHTFDVLPWRDVPGCVLTDQDLAGGGIVTHVADLTRAEVFEQHRPLVESAGLLFVDAAKDGTMERVLLERFESARFHAPPIVAFDDVRLWNMLRIWREVARPKLDLTSFGHWSGTGLVDWQPAAR